MVEKRIFRVDILGYPRSDYDFVKKITAYWLTYTAILTGCSWACYTQIQTSRISQPQLSLWCFAKNIWQIRKAVRKVDKNTFIVCKLCEKAFTSNARTVSADDNKAVINTMLCHQCTNCREDCPKAAIKYSK